MFDLKNMIGVWDRLEKLPGGKRVFSRLVGYFAPYTGTMGAVVEALAPGHAKVRLPDRRGVRNHLESIHAMALANFGEMATGLALTTALPSSGRAILTGFSIRYLKKGRGELVAEARVPVIDQIAESRTIEVSAAIRDRAGDEVATVTAAWLAGPRKKG